MIVSLEVSTHSRPKAAGRDNDKIAEIETEVIAFLTELNEQINKLEGL